MKARRLVTLTEELVEGQEIVKQIDPFYAQALVDVLVHLGFKIDLGLTELLRYVPQLQHFGYRTHSRRIKANARGKVFFYDAHHEGLHNLIGLKFGAGLPRRPRMTLLNEAMGAGTEIYSVAKLSAHFGLKTMAQVVPQIPEYQRTAKRLGVPLQPLLDEAIKNPFAAYRENSLALYRLFLHMLESLEKHHGHSEAWLREYHAELKATRNLVFLAYIQGYTPALFVAHNCGVKSSLEDLRSAEACVELLEKSRTMDDFLTGLGAANYLNERLKKSA